MVRLSERRQLGSSKIVIPPLGFGCAPIGEIYDRVSDAAAAATFQRAFELGIRYFDVAPSYGAGLAELRLGRAIRRAADDVDSFRVERSDIFVSTKVCRQLLPDRRSTPNTMDHSDDHGWAGGLNGFNSVMDCTYDGFMRQHTESLHRMGLSHVDGLLMHSQPLPGTKEWDQLTLGGGFRAMEYLRKSGAVSAIGTGGGTYSTLVPMLKHCSLDYVCLPTSYTLLGQEVHDDGTLQLATDHNIGVVIFAPFNGGILVGGSKAAANRAKFNYLTASDEIVERVAALESVCAKHNVSLPAAALHFPLMHPAVASVVCGVASPAEAEANVALLDAVIPFDLWRSFKEAGLLRGDIPIVERSEREHASL